MVIRFALLATLAAAFGCGGAPAAKAKSPVAEGNDPALAESAAKAKAIEAAHRAAEAKALGKHKLARD